MWPFDEIQREAERVRDQVNNVVLKGEGTPWGTTDKRQSIDLNPFHSTMGRLKDPSGLSSQVTDEFNKLIGVEGGAAGSVSQWGRPDVNTSSGGGGAGGSGSAPAAFSPNNAASLEARLRGEERKKLPKNVEFGFNLEQNPYGTKKR